MSALKQKDKDFEYISDIRVKFKFNLAQGFPTFLTRDPHVQIMDIRRPPSTYLCHDTDDNFEILFIIAGIL